jgi:hypothetical protein
VSQENREPTHRRRAVAGGGEAAGVIVEGAAASVTIYDFVVATLDEARHLIREGARNRLDPLEQSCLSRAEAEAELKRIDAGTRGRR